MCCSSHLEAVIVTSRAIAGDGSSHRQAITFLKPRGGATTCSDSGDHGEDESPACPACTHSSALWHWAPLASELLWQCLHFDSPEDGGNCPTVVTSQEGCNTFSQLGNQFGGTSILACFSCGTWDVVGSSRGPPMGTSSSMVTTLDGMSVEVGGVSGVSFKIGVWLPKHPSGRATLPKTASLEKETYCSIILHTSRMDPPKVVVNLA